MQSLQKQFHDFILANHLVKNGEKVLLAVSGGLDSMVMANLFLIEGIPFAIAHCNFGLRGDESDGDEAFVLNWADENKVNCYVKAFEISESSIQLEARNVRYTWFKELTLAHGFHKIATAHHLNDSLETMLINLSRGTGIKGISGIPVSNLNVIRPLLFAEKERLYDYAMDEELEWREDSSNEKTDYDRNLLRHDVIPDLLKLNPSFFKTFGLTMERLTHTSDVLNKQVEEVRLKYLSGSNKSFQLDLSWMNEPTDELILAELLVPYGINYVTAKEIFLSKGNSGKQFPANNWIISMDRNVLFVNGNEEGKPTPTLLRVKSVGEHEFDIGRLVVERVLPDDVDFSDPFVQFFDGQILEFPFTIRPWKEGDRFRPLGMNGVKKLSDYLIDEKIPISEKKKVRVLESKDDIAWLLGMRISDLFKISSETTDVIKITFLPSDS